MEKYIHSKCSDIKNWNTFDCVALVPSLPHTSAQKIINNVLPHPTALPLCYNPSTYHLCDSFMQTYCSTNPDALICGCYTGKIENVLVGRSQATYGCVTGDSTCTNDCSGKFGPCHTEQSCSLDCLNSNAVKRPSLNVIDQPMTCPTRMCVFDYDNLSKDNIQSVKFTDSCVGCDDNCTCIVFNENAQSLQCSKKAMCINGTTGEIIDCDPGDFDMSVRDYFRVSTLHNWFITAIITIVIGFVLLSCIALIYHNNTKSGKGDNNPANTKN